MLKRVDCEQAEMMDEQERSEVYWKIPVGPPRLVASVPWKSWCRGACH